MKVYTVYKITNLVNGKIYIGCHVTENINDSYMGSGKAIQDAILKYGKDSFRKEILQCFDSPEKAYEMESILVNENFVASKETYNYKVGGFGGCKNLIWVNNGKSEKRIPKNSEIESGWVLGRLENYNLGRVYINNGSVNKAVKRSDVDIFLESGWCLGRLKGNQKNKKHMNKNGTGKLVPIDQVNDHLSNGWKLGTVR